MPDEVNPPAVVQTAQALADILAAFGQFEEGGQTRLRAARLLGKQLTVEKERIPYGGWLEWCESNLPFSRSRVADFLRLHEHRARCSRAATFEEALEIIREAMKASESSAPSVQAPVVFHAPAEAEVPPVKPPLTERERRILMRLIGTKKPKLADQMLKGKRKATDAELEKLCPLSCHKCQQSGPPVGRACVVCERMQKEAKADRQEQQQELKYPDEPEATEVVTPPDPYAQLRKALSTATRLMNQLAIENPQLSDAVSWAGFAEHQSDGSIKVFPLMGLPKLVDLASKGLVKSKAQIVSELRKACGLDWEHEKQKWRKSNKKGRGQ